MGGRRALINEHRPLGFSGETATRLPRIREVPPSNPGTQRTCLYRVSVPLVLHSKTPLDFIRSFYSIRHSYCIYSKMSLRFTPKFQAVKANKTFFFRSSLLEIGYKGTLMDRKLQCAQNASDDVFYNRVIFGSVHKIAKSDCWLRHVSPSVCSSTLMAQLGSH